MASSMASAEHRYLEIHNKLAETSDGVKRVALTLDACSGKFDTDLIYFLINYRIPATLFVTKKWLDNNPAGIEIIRSNLDLFDVEDHGANHIPAVIGVGKRVYGIQGVQDVDHLRREVEDGSLAIKKEIGVTPRWYRGATAEYDEIAILEIEKMGYKIAGFSLNADSGATASKAIIEKRLLSAKDRDVIIAHINKPQSESAEGLSAGLLKMMNSNFVFVRLDQVDLIRIN